MRRLAHLFVLLLLLVLVVPGQALSMTAEKVERGSMILEDGGGSSGLAEMNGQSISRAIEQYYSWKLRGALAETKQNAPVIQSTRQTTGEHAVSTVVKTPPVSGLEIRYNKNGTPAMIKAKRLFTRKDAAAKPGTRVWPGSTGARDTAVACLEHYKGLFHINNASDEFKVKAEVPDKLGLRHIRFQQVYRGVPVWGKEIIVHLDRQGDVYGITADAEPTPNLDIKPGLTAEKAREIVEEDLGGLNEAKLELVIYTGTDGSTRLAYHAEARRGYERWKYFVDALNGRVLEKYNDTWYYSVPGSGTDLAGRTRNFSVWRQDGKYYLIDTSQPFQSADPLVPGEPGRGNIIMLDGRHQLAEALSTAYFITGSSPAGGWDASAVSALHGFIVTSNYYWENFQRRSIDDRGLNIMGVVHVGEDWENACWTGQVMFFGDGAGNLSPLAGGLDVIAHEYTHGVVEYTAGLEYKYQSGALNEAFCDIFACMVDREDWLIGEDITRVEPGLLRDLANPHAGMDSQPADMSEYRNMSLEEDNGGVHINSSIPARAAYLLAEGMDNSVGRAKTEEIFYRALTLHLTRQSDFYDCRLATMQSAEELYGAGSPEVQAVQAAWDAVGVLDDGTGAPGSGDELKVEPDIQVSPTSIDFGSVTVGQAGSRVVTIDNEGSYSLTLDNIQLSDSVNFSHNGTHDVILPGDSVKVTVTFKPDSAGSKQAALVIKCDDPDTPVVTINLTGLGVAGSIPGYIPWEGGTPTRNVPADKEWRIEFNYDLDPASLPGGIFICPAGSSGRFPVSPDVDPASPNVVIVRHSEPFAPGGDYVLYISTTVRAAAGGSTLRQGIMMPFTVAP